MYTAQQRNLNVCVWPSTSCICRMTSRIFPSFSVYSSVYLRISHVRLYRDMTKKYRDISHIAIYKKYRDISHIAIYKKYRDISHIAIYRGSPALDYCPSSVENHIITTCIFEWLLFYYYSRLTKRFFRTRLYI